MVRTHPQWVAVRDSVARGELGELRAIQGFFSYDNDDPADIRNQADIGGGGMLDIGCYPATTSRFVTQAEPTRVMAMVDHDPRTGIDRLGSALLDFPGVQASFVYGTQAFPYQRMTFVGTAARVEVEIPFNAPAGRAVSCGTAKTGLARRPRSPTSPPATSTPSRRMRSPRRSWMAPHSRSRSRTPSATWGCSTPCWRPPRRAPGGRPEPGDPGSVHHRARQRRPGKGSDLV
jgi:predicted dehydrogenase